MELSGAVSSDAIYELRFPLAGKVSILNVKAGDHVTKGALLCRLDPSELQLLLDRSLKVYESVRAEFEEKQSANLNQFDRLKLQSDLDISVKNVEIAKSNLEATNLYAPISGTIISIDSVIPGMNITPAALTITLLADDSFNFSALIPEADIFAVSVDAEVIVNLTVNPDKNIKGKVARVGLAADKAGRFTVIVSLVDQTDLRLGLTGVLKVNNNDQEKTETQES